MERFGVDGCGIGGVRRFALAVEGLVGAGKSRMLRTVESNYATGGAQDGVRFVLEPAESGFTRFGKFNPLELCYENPSKNFPCCQMHILRCIERHYESMLGDHAPTASDNITKVVTERSPYSPEIFIRTQAKLGMITDFTEEFLLSQAREHAERLLGGYAIQLVGIVYIDVPIETCLERIGLRARGGEDKIDMDFLRTLENEYRSHLEEIEERYAEHDLRFDLVKLRSPDDDTMRKYVQDFVDSDIW